MVLRGSVWREIAAHVASTYPEEGCGILIGTRQADRLAVQVESAQRCENRAPPELRTRRFEIDPGQVIRTQRELRGSGRQVVGFYHSHPDAAAAPSRTDLPFFRLWPDTVWLIAEVADGRVSDRPRAWWLEPGSEEPGELSVDVGPSDESDDVSTPQP